MEKGNTMAVNVNNENTFAEQIEVFLEEFAGENFEILTTTAREYHVVSFKNDTMNMVVEVNQFDQEFDLEVIYNNNDTGYQHSGIITVITLDDAKTALEEILTH